jgi:PQQ-like domain
VPRGDDAAQLHRSRRRARVRRRRVVGIALLLAAAAAGAALAMRGGTGARPAAARTTGPTPPGTTTPPSGTPRPETLRIRTVAQLPAPLQDAAVSAVGGSVYVFGGLDATGASLATVSVVAGGTVHGGGTLPVPVHDAASAAVGGRLLVLGGGQQASYPGIATFDRASRRTRIVATMPTPLSDLAATTIGRTVYVVGGFTGTAWSSSILAVTGGHVRVVGHLPVGLRYAAVANVGGTVLVAGGRTTSGPSAAIYSFTPATGEVRRIGSLPQPLMHASAGTLGGRMYVVGGIGSDGRPVPSVLAVAPDGSVTRAGSLPAPLSDAGVATLPGHLVVVGGSMGAAPTPAVLDLRLGRAPTAAPAHHHHRNHAGLPRMFRGPLPGDLLIADRGNDRILLIDPAGHILWRYPSRAGQRRLNFDDDAFFTPGGRGIISNEEDNHTIVQIAYPSGRLQWSYGHAGAPGASPGYLNTPDDAYRLRNGLVIVSDNRNCRLLEIRGHRVVRSIGSPASCVHDPPRSLGSPNGDTPLPDGHILISEIYGSYVDEVTMTGHLVRSFHVPVGYPSDPQLTQHGNILLADYSRPGAVVIVDRFTGRLLWRYGPSSGPGELDHPSLASMLPNGDVMVVDDYNDRIVIVDPHTNRIVWQYGHTAVGGTAPGYLHVPDGFDFVPVTPAGKPDPAAIRHGP